MVYSISHKQGTALDNECIAKLNDIARRDLYKPVSEHFAKHDVSNLIVTPLRKCRDDTNTRLRLKEALIANFKTRQPNGLKLIN